MTGFEVGGLDGLNVGTAEGTTLGFAEGLVVGATVGAVVGSTVGSSVGSAVGSIVEPEECAATNRHTNTRISRIHIDRMIRCAGASGSELL